MLEKLKNKLSQTTDGFIQIVSVPSEVREERLNICMSCENLVKHINMCNKCGCIVNAKTWIPKSSCPVKKWDKYLPLCH